MIVLQSLTADEPVPVRPDRWLKGMLVRVTRNGKEYEYTKGFNNTWYARGMDCAVGNVFVVWSADDSGVHLTSPPGMDVPGANYRYPSEILEFVGHV